MNEINPSIDLDIHIQKMEQKIQTLEKVPSNQYIKAYAQSEIQTVMRERSPSNER